MHGKLSVRKLASTRLVAVSSSRSANLLQAQEKLVDRRYSAFRQSPQILGALFFGGARSSLSAGAGSTDPGVVGGFVCLGSACASGFGFISEAMRPVVML